MSINSFSDYLDYIRESRHGSNIVFVEDIDDPSVRSGYLSVSRPRDTIARLQTIGGQRRNVSERDIYALEPGTKYGKKVYRYDTPKTRGIQRPVIKIDLQKERVYFADDESLDRDDEVIKFVRQGEKIKFLVVYDKAKFMAAQ